MSAADREWTVEAESTPLRLLKGDRERAGDILVDFSRAIEAWSDVIAPSCSVNTRLGVISATFQVEASIAAAASRAAEAFEGALSIALLQHVARVEPTVPLPRIVSKMPVRLVALVAPELIRTLGSLDVVGRISLTSDTSDEPDPAALDDDLARRLRDIVPA